VLAWFGGPLVGVISLHSVLYDGWRHLYFIYPAFVLVAGLGLQVVWQDWQRGRTRAASPTTLATGTLLLALALGTAQVAWRMVAEHPFQYAYFSFLPGRVIEQNFERDYWGLSVKQGLEWVLAHDTRPAVPVSMDARTEMTLRINAKMLPPAARARLRLVVADSAGGGRGRSRGVAAALNGGLAFSL